MPLQVTVTPRAEAQILAIEAWWRENRPSAPDLFVDELAEAFSTLSLIPLSGTPYDCPEPEGVRRLPLRLTRNHIYYVTTDETLTILAVWGSTRGRGPDLSGL